MDKFGATSTPRRPVDLRRKSMINASIVASPLRKSFIGPMTPRSALEPADEEAERSTRRSMVAMQKRLTNSAAPGSPLIDPTVAMDNSQLKNHLEFCTKLFMENKICVKNVWKMHVIDAMKKILEDNRENILQVGGSSLDVGSKVYGLRVDDVHAKGLQLASTMSKSNEAKQAQEDNDGLETTISERPRRNVRRKNKKMSADKRTIIDHEGKSLFGSIKHVDSVIFATKENIDIAAVDNLFTHKYPINPSSHEFMVLSQSRYWSHDPDSSLDKWDKPFETELPDINNHHICAAFKDFEIGFWDPAAEEQALAETPSLPEAILDENGLPIAELDGSIHDIFQDDVPEEQHVSDDEEQEVIQAQIHGGIDHIVDAIPEENQVENDYGYNTLLRTTSGKYINKIWAGPSHWKVKYNRRSTARFSGSVQQVVKHARKSKVADPLDIANLVLEDVFPTLPKVVRTRTCKSVPFEKITLPVPELVDDFDKQIDNIFMKLSIRRPKWNKTRREPHDYEVQVYNYANPNDSHYCSQNNSADSDNEPMANSFEEALSASEEKNLEHNLVDAPEMVSAVHIPFAQRAKKMDMKKLKSAVLKCLNKDAENVDDQRGLQIQPMQFSSLYQSLPDVLPADMKKELSCPLAMVALLHLCNEHNLELSKEKNHKDFTIFKPQS